MVARTIVLRQKMMAIIRQKKTITATAAQKYMRKFITFIVCERRKTHTHIAREIYQTFHRRVTIAIIS